MVFFLSQLRIIIVTLQTLLGIFTQNYVSYQLTLNMLSTLFGSSIFALFIIITIGFVVGRINFKGINLDVSAVIFVALLFGHYGVEIPAALGNFGMVLFIFAVGIQAGPGFFDTFRSKGKSLTVMALILVGTAALTTIGVSYVFGFSAVEAAGLLTGSLTSTPGLATAKEIAGDAAAISYSIAYPFGVIGVILFIKLLPSILKINIADEQKKLDAQSKALFPDINASAFEVTNPLIIDKALSELSIRTLTGATISRAVRDDISFIPSGKDCLKIGDKVKAVGTSEALQKLEKMLGARLEGELPFGGGIVLETALITRKELVGKPLSSLSLQQNFGCNVTRVRRAGVDIAPDPTLKLKFGDKLTLVAPQEHMKELMKLLGNQKKKISDTDFFPIALGIVIGVLVGHISISFESFSFTLGLTGGVLLTALVLSAVGKTGSVIWTMSSSANQLLRQLGLLLFLANVGTSAGATLVETFQQSGWSLFVGGVFITVLPMIITTVIARSIFKINLIELLGALAGGMTSTPGLAAADSMSSSSAASVAYATVYPVAMVLLIILTQITTSLL